ncbi:hypothetical protein [Streptomyces sp. NPDC093261]|uniref:hypothetical protein n=1 Tax=Streptomyces sp. NPDC093261 TaxID=3366037 RepID=UPI00381747D1
MGDYSEDLARIDQELREAERERNRLTARIAALQAERDAFLKLEDGPTDLRQKLDDLTKAEAIVKILKEADRLMTLGDIAEAMTTAGKVTTKNGASVYIDGLLKAGRVVRVARGQYRAA